MSERSTWKCAECGELIQQSDLFYWRFEGDFEGLEQYELVHIRGQGVNCTNNPIDGTESYHITGEDGIRWINARIQEGHLAWSLNLKDLIEFLGFNPSDVTGFVEFRIKRRNLRQPKTRSS